MKLLYISILTICLGTIYTMCNLTNLARKFMVIQKSNGLNSDNPVFFHQPIFLVIFRNGSDVNTQKDIQLLIDYQIQPRFSMRSGLFRRDCDNLCQFQSNICKIINQTHVSVYQMLKGLIVVFTFSLSIVIFKKQYQFYHYFSVFLIFLGCFIVGKSNLGDINEISKKFQIDAPNPLLGNVLCILAQFLLSLMFVYEEILLKDQEINVYDLVGWEGVWGMLFSAIILLFTTFYKDQNILPKDDIFFATSQVIHSQSLQIFLTLAFLSMGPFNYFGNIITKYSTSVNRCTIDSLRMIGIYLNGIIFLNDQIRTQQIIGYALILLGSLIYNDAFPQIKFFQRFQEKMNKIFYNWLPFLNQKQQYETVKPSQNKDLQTQAHDMVKTQQSYQWIDKESNTMSLDEILDVLHDSKDIIKLY